MAKANRTGTLLRGWQIQKQDGLGRRRALEALLRGRRQVIPEEPPAAHAGGPDPVDVAQEQEEEMVWLAVMDRSHAIQVQMYEALRRLVDGELWPLRRLWGIHLSTAAARAALRCALPAMSRAF